MEIILYLTFVNFLVIGLVPVVIFCNSEDDLMIGDWMMIIMFIMIF